VTWHALCTSLCTKVRKNGQLSLTELRRLHKDAVKKKNDQDEAEEAEEAAAEAAEYEGDLEKDRIFTQAWPERHLLSLLCIPLSVPAECSGLKCAVFKLELSYSPYLPIATSSLQNVMCRVLLRRSPHLPTRVS